jgi:hypothetical protein
MAGARLYVVTPAGGSAPYAVANAKSLLQVVTGAVIPVELVRAQVAEVLSTTSTKQRIEIGRVSVYTTGMTALAAANALPITVGDSASSLSFGTALTASWLTSQTEGTHAQPLVEDVFNFLSPWVMLPVPEERVNCQAAGAVSVGNIVMWFPVAPASGSFNWEFLLRELC